MMTDDTPHPTPAEKCTRASTRCKAAHRHAQNLVFQKTSLGSMQSEQTDHQLAELHTHDTFAEGHA
jgi:hypothetical protein